MIEVLQILQGVMERGIIFGILVIGVYLSSRIIKFDNLSVEGAFGLGGGITALLLNQKVNPWIVLCIAMLGGVFSGVITGYINRKFEINSLISGIIVTTALFSVTLKIAGSNMILQDRQTIFQGFSMIFPDFQYSIILFLVAFVAIIFLKFFLKTEIGFLLYALGDNPQMLLNLGKSVNFYTMLGLAISNAAAALAASLYVQYVGYFSIWAGTGILIIGLAGMILGELLSPYFGFAIIYGSILYQMIITMTFEFQINQDWNKLITAVLITVMLLGKKTETNKLR
jgi:putative ABC transport system permease protein